MKGLALDSGEFISADELNARIPHSNPDNWQQYATEREETAQAVIERHRGEIKSLLNLLAKDRGKLQALRAQIGQDVPALLEQIANEPPINGNAMAQARILMKAAKLRASAPQADRSGCTAGTDEECKNRQCATQCPKRAQIGQGVPVAEIEITRNKRTGELESYCFSKTPKDAPEGTYSVYTHPAPQKKPLTDEHRQELALTLMAAKLAPSGSVPVHCAAFIALCAAHNIGEKK